MKKIILITLLCIAFNPAYGGIEWKTRELAIEIQKGQGPVEVDFPFTITGAESVGVISTKPSCACVTVDSAVLGEHKPGTEGTLKVRYTPSDNSAGTIAERITVETTDPNAPKIDLQLMIHLPLTYRIEPKYAFWNMGEDPEAKDLYFIDITGKGYKPVAIYSTSVNFTATLIPPEGKATRYIIRIKPVSTMEAGGARVYLDVDTGDGTIEKRGILAAIRDPKNPQIKITTQ